MQDRLIPIKCYGKIKITCTVLTFPYFHFSLAKSRYCLLLSLQLVGCYHPQCDSNQAIP